MTPTPATPTTALPASAGPSAGSGTPVQATTGSPLAQAMEMMKATGISGVSAQATQATPAAQTLPAALAANTNTLSVNVKAVPMVMTQPTEGGATHAQVAIPPQMPVAAAPPQPFAVSPLASPLSVGVVPGLPNGAPGPSPPASSSNPQLAVIMNGMAEMQRNMAAVMGTLPYAQGQSAPTALVDPARLAPSPTAAQASVSRGTDLANLVVRMDTLEKQQASLQSALDKERQRRVRFKMQQVRSNNLGRGKKNVELKEHLRLSRRVDLLANRMNRMKHVGEQVKVHRLPVAQQEGLPVLSEKEKGLGLMRTFFHRKTAASER